MMPSNSADLFMTMEPSSNTYLFKIPSLNTLISKTWYFQRYMSDMVTILKAEAEGLNLHVLMYLILGLLVPFSIQISAIIK